VVLGFGSVIATVTKGGISKRVRIAVWILYTRSGESAGEAGVAWGVCAVEIAAKKKKTKDK